MKILHVSTQSSWGGGEQQVIYLLEGLERRGHRVILACRPDTPLALRAEEIGIEVYPVRPFNEGDPFTALRLARLLWRWRPDLVHVHSPHAQMLTYLAAWVSPRIPRVASRRVEFTIYRKLTLGVNYLKYRFGVHHYVAVSEAARRGLIRDRMPPDRISVVHSGIDLASRGWTFPERTEAWKASLSQELGVPGGLPVVAIAGVIDVNKGQEVLVRACAGAARHRPFVALFLGDGPERERLEELSRELDIAHLVAFPGFRDDVLECQALADIYVQLSLQEGLGTSILDALALGTPVIATRVGGTVEILGEDGDCGLLIPPRSPEALEEAISHLLTHPELRETFRQRGLRVIEERFSVDGMVDGTLAVYQRLTTRAGVDPEGEAGTK